MISSNVIRLATRGSTLALWQTNRVADLLCRKNPGVQVETVVVSTRPDREQALSLLQMGGDKGLFVKEVEQALLDGSADAAVHSLKDYPVESVTPGTVLVAYPEREDARDVLVSRDGKKLACLSPGSVVATSAPRRRAQVLHCRPDLAVCEVRGNIETRLKKMDDAQFDAIVMAAAALRRLDLFERAVQVFSPSEVTPAPGQGIIVVQCAAGSPWKNALSEINNSDVQLQAEAERHFSRALEATCHTAAGCFVNVAASGVCTIHMAVCSPDGALRFYRHRSTSREEVIPTVDAMVDEYRSAVNG